MMTAAARKMVSRPHGRPVCKSGSSTAAGRESEGRLMNNGAVASTPRGYLWLLTALALVPACSGGPTPVELPDVSPGAAADRALQQYDADGDGVLSRAELAACPAMLAAMDHYDRDRSGTVSKEEIADRISSWQRGGIAIVQLICKVTRDGRPVEGATVRLNPEPFLGGEIKPAVGTTRKGGMAVMEIPAEELPSDMKDVRGVHCGVYKVEITHPQQSIPARYNSETQLGHEVARDFGTPYATFDIGR